MAGALITDVGTVAMGTTPALAAVTPGAGSSFTIRSVPSTSRVLLSDLWRKGTAAGAVRVTSPNLVPVSNGIYLRPAAGLGDFLFGGPPTQVLKPQDTLVIEDLGGASETDLVAMQAYYAASPGGQVSLVSPGDIAGAAEFVFGWPVAAAAAAVAGGQGQTNITSTVDSSTADRWYAVMGYLCDTQVGAVGIQSPNTSQYFVGGPGDTDARFTRNYFLDLSMMLGAPCVPLIAAANKASTNVVVADNAASTAVNVTLILAQMPETYSPPAV